MAGLMCGSGLFGAAASISWRGVARMRQFGASYYFDAMYEYDPLIYRGFF